MKGKKAFDWRYSWSSAVQLENRVQCDLLLKALWDNEIVSDFCGVVNPINFEVVMQLVVGESLGAWGSV